jgi:hypothetical protein
VLYGCFSHFRILNFKIRDSGEKKMDLKGFDQIINAKIRKKSKGCLYWRFYELRHGRLLRRLIFIGDFIMNWLRHRGSQLLGGCSDQIGVCLDTHLFVFRDPITLEIVDRLPLPTPPWAIAPLRGCDLAIADEAGFASVLTKGAVRQMASAESARLLGAIAQRKLPDVPFETAELRLGPRLLRVAKRPGRV